MSKKLSTSFFILVLSMVSFASCGYNTMQRLEEEVNQAWGDRESNLQRRSDLIPNLVQTVKGYASHEKETLSAVIEARAKATSTQLNVKNLANNYTLFYAKASINKRFIDFLRVDYIIPFFSRRLIQIKNQK